MQPATRLQNLLNGIDMRSIQLLYSLQHTSCCSSWCFLLYNSTCNNVTESDCASQKYDVPCHMLHTSALVGCVKVWCNRFTFKQVKVARQPVTLLAYYLLNATAWACKTRAICSMLHNDLTCCSDRCQKDKHMNSGAAHNPFCYKIDTLFSGIAAKGLPRCCGKRFTKMQFACKQDRWCTLCPQHIAEQCPLPPAALVSLLHAAQCCARVLLLNRAIESRAWLGSTSSNMSQVQFVTTSCKAVCDGQQASWPMLDQLAWFPAAHRMTGLPQHVELNNAGKYAADGGYVSITSLRSASFWQALLYSALNLTWELPCKPAETYWI